MKILHQGEVLKYRQTGVNFEVKKITGDFVILHSKEDVLQIMTGKRSVFHLFEKLPMATPRLTPKDVPFKG